MELKKFDLPFSLKNIPIPNPDYYRKMLIARTEQFIERLRWKVNFYLNPQDENREVLKTTLKMDSKRRVRPHKHRN